MENNFLNNLSEMPRSVMPLLFMVDTSGSMCGAKIAALNTAVRESLNEVGDISKNCADARIKVNALEFNTNVRWMYPAPVDAETFQWQDLTTGGCTHFGEAVKELNSKLTRQEGGFIEASGARRAPAIILLSDGEPTDSYKNNLKTIRSNQWFDVAVKVAIAVGDQADTDMLAEFTGSKESVITVHDVDQLKKIIRTVSVSSSTVGSTSAVAGATMVTPQAQVNAAISQSVAADPTLSGVDLNGSTANAGTDSWGSQWS